MPIPHKYGEGQYGQVPYGGGSPGHYAPTVTVAAFAGNLVPANNGVFTVNWTYTQTEGVPQGTFQVKIQNAAGSITYYDSGTLNGSQSSFQINTVGTNIPTDTTGQALKATVTITSKDGAAFSATASNTAFDIQWGVVTVAITSPTSTTLSGSSVPVSWTFASTRSLTEASYRVQLVSPDNVTIVFFDSGSIPGNLVAYNIQFAINGGTRYQIRVTAVNTAGASGVGTFVFTGQTYDPSQILDNKQVGTWWAVAINGYGFMMAEDPTVPHWYKQIYLRNSQMIDGGSTYRIATGSQPFSGQVQRYVFTGFQSWETGAGQTYADRDTSLATRYLNSEGINPFTKYQLTLLPSTSVQAASAYTPCQAVAVNGVLYMVTGTNKLTSFATPGAVGTQFTIAGITGTINDITTDGQYWYVSSPQGVFRNNTNVDPGAAWCTIAGATNYQAISWAGMRICLTYVTASNVIFSTLTPAGAEEVAAGRLKMPPGWTIGKASGGTGHMWFPVSFGDTGNTIYSWDLVNANAPSPGSLPLLGGEIPRAVYWYAGNVMVKVDYGNQGILYRCTPDPNGNLVPFVVTDSLPVTGNAGTFSFLGSGRRIYFSWPNMTQAGNNGIGALDITTGGFCKWEYSSITTNQQVRSLVFWAGQLGFTVDGSGLFYESATGFVASGFLTTSVSDKSTSVLKSLDTLSANCLPLGANQSVTIDYSLDGAQSYVGLAGASMTGAGLTNVKATVNQSAPSVAFRITLNGPGTSTPTFTLLQARMHHIGLGDSMITIPIDCRDNISRLNGAAAPFNGYGTGFARAKMLEGWLGQRVKFQDQDWAITGQSEVLEVHDVEIRGLSLYSPHFKHSDPGCVAIVTLIKRIA